MKDKKGQIGETLTWVVAFLIIFFIMALFIVVTAIIKGAEIDVEYFSSGLDVQRKLVTFLNSPIDEKPAKEVIFDKKYLSSELRGISGIEKRIFTSKEIPDERIEYYAVSSRDERVNAFYFANYTEKTKRGEMKSSSALIVPFENRILLITFYKEELYAK